MRGFCEGFSSDAITNAAKTCKNIWNKHMFNNMFGVVVVDVKLNAAKKAVASTNSITVG